MRFGGFILSGFAGMRHFMAMFYICDLSKFATGRVKRAELSPRQASEFMKKLNAFIDLCCDR